MDDDLRWIGNKDTPRPIRLFLKEMLDAIPKQEEWELYYHEAISNLLGVHEEGKCELCPFDASFDSPYESEMFGVEYYRIPVCKLKRCWITTAKGLLKKYNPKEPEHPEKIKKKYEREKAASEKKWKAHAAKLTKIKEEEKCQ